MATRVSAKTNWEVQVTTPETPLILVTCKGEIQAKELRAALSDKIKRGTQIVGAPPISLGNKVTFLSCGNTEHELAVNAKILKEWIQSFIKQKTSQE